MQRRAVIPILYLLLLACTAAIFLPARNFQFVNWDDRDMLIENPLLHPPTAEHLQQIWAGPVLKLYTPLPYCLWWIALRISHGSAGPQSFHLINIALHMASAALVFSILLRCVQSTLPAFAGALLFALHPLQVESVVWISELNNVLAGALSLAAIRLYLAFADAESRRRWIIYAIASLAFLLALFSKPSAVVVPLIAIILDFGFLRRPARRAVASILPWLCAAGLFAIIAQRAQPGPDVPIWLRPIVAMDALGFYLGHLFWPAHLTVDYARTPGSLWISHRWIATSLSALAVTVVLWLLRRRARGIGLAALVAVAALIPVLGLVPFVFQRYSTVADRYVYLAMLGPALALAAIRGRAMLTIAAALIAFLAWQTTMQIKTWRDDDALVGHILKLDPHSTIGNKIRGQDLAREHRWTDAIPYYQTALLRNSGDGDIHYNLANAYLYSSDLGKAVAEYQIAIGLLDGESRLRAMNNLGIAYFRSGHPAEAESEFEQVLRLDPGNADAARNLRVLAGQGVPSR
jgi:tetratricopeptide (TPR) repeat protein